MLRDVSPRSCANLYEDREIAYQADAVMLDGKMFDLSCAESIRSIPIPAFSATWDVLELSYIMKIRCSVVTDISILRLFIDKTIELMHASKMIWQKKDYLQVIRNYYRCGMFAEGDAFETQYRARFSDLAVKNGEKAELEHERTKRYFYRKWEKKHRTPIN